MQHCTATQQRLVWWLQACVEQPWGPPDTGTASQVALQRQHPCTTRLSSWRMESIHCQQLPGGSGLPHHAHNRNHTHTQHPHRVSTPTTGTLAHVGVCSGNTNGNPQRPCRHTIACMLCRPMLSSFGEPQQHLNRMAWVARQACGTIPSIHHHA